MPFPYVFSLAGGGVLLAVTLLWLLSLPLHNAGIMDLFWGIGFIIIAWLPRS